MTRVSLVVLVVALAVTSELGGVSQALSIGQRAPLTSDSGSPVNTISPEQRDHVFRLNVGLLDQFLNDDDRRALQELTRGDGVDWAKQANLTLVVDKVGSVVNSFVEENRDVRDTFLDLVAALLPENTTKAVLEVLEVHPSPLVAALTNRTNPEIEHLFSFVNSVVHHPSGGAAVNSTVELTSDKDSLAALDRLLEEHFNRLLNAKGLEDISKSHGTLLRGVVSAKIPLTALAGNNPSNYREHLKLIYNQLPSVTKFQQSKDRSFVNEMRKKTQQLGSPLPADVLSLLELGSAVRLQGDSDNNSDSDHNSNSKEESSTEESSKEETGEEERESRKEQEERKRQGYKSGRIFQVDQKMKWPLRLGIVTLFIGTTITLMYKYIENELELSANDEWDSEKCKVLHTGFTRSFCQFRVIRTIGLMLLDVTIVIGTSYTLLLTLGAAAEARAANGRTLDVDLQTLMKDEIERNAAEELTKQQKNKENNNNDENNNNNDENNNNNNENNNENDDKDFFERAMGATSLLQVDSPNWLFLSLANRLNSQQGSQKAIQEDQLNEDKLVDFKASIRKYMDKHGGILSADKLLRTLKKLGVKDTFARDLITAMNTNEGRTVTVAEARQSLLHSYVSVFHSLVLRSREVVGALVLFVISSVFLFATDQHEAHVIGIVGFIPVCLLFSFLSEITKNRKHSENSMRMWLDTINNGIVKIVLTFVSVLVFAGIYHGLKHCTDPVSMCSNGAKPICMASGLPPKYHQCIRGAVDCSWTAEGAGLTVCPVEEVIYGTNDQGHFSTLHNSNREFDLTLSTEPPFDFLSDTYQIGIAHGLDLAEMKMDGQGLINSLKNEYSYAYAESGKTTTVQNLLQTLPDSEFDPNEETASITHVALVPSESTCSAATADPVAKALVAKDFGEDRLTNLALKTASVIPVYTLDSSTSSNNRMCFQNATGWYQIPNAWVITGSVGGCSDPDCTGADFTDGLGKSFIDAVYYALIVQTTIGYGDILSISDRAKVASALQGLVMIAIENSL